jgi:hypothetical protein
MERRTPNGERRHCSASAAASTIICTTIRERLVRRGLSRQSPSQTRESGKVPVGGDPDTAVFQGVGRQKRVLHQITLRISLFAQGQCERQHPLSGWEHREPRRCMQRTRKIGYRPKRGRTFRKLLSTRPRATAGLKDN